MVDAADKHGARAREGGDIGGFLALAETGSLEVLVVDTMIDEGLPARLARFLAHQPVRAVDDEIGARLHGHDLARQLNAVAVGKRLEAVGALEGEADVADAVDEIGAWRAVDPQQRPPYADAAGGEGDLRCESPIGRLATEAAGNRYGRKDVKAVLDVDDAARQARKLAADALEEEPAVAELRHAHANRVDEQDRDARREPPHDLEVVVATIVVPPVFPADADDAIRACTTHAFSPAHELHWPHHPCAALTL